MSHMQKLLDMLKFLRTSPDGCAWTKAQTHPSIATNFIEETYEALEAIDQKNDPELRDELGDVLLQIVFHAQIADERGAFGFDDVAKAITDKLERRYPTIFGDEPNTLKTPDEIAARWEKVKEQERLKKGIKTEDASIFNGISHGIPALMRAQKIKARGVNAGWVWENVDDLLLKIDEEVQEVKNEVKKKSVNQENLASEIGDVISLLVSLAQWHGIDAEDALRTTNNRTEKRIRYVEKQLKAQGLDFKTAPKELKQKLWNEMKEIEKRSQSASG